MGHGEYSVQNSINRSQTLNYASRDTKDVFSKKRLDNAMNPNGVEIRESRDSEEHPNSIAIMLGLDVTGSMGRIPHMMIVDGLTTVMGTIIERGVEDPQLMFTGVGDHITDQAPLQVSQFESSDELLDKWLKDIWLEGGGGGNGGESYPLVWYFAGFHTSIDCLEKRGQKGVLFTVGDDAPHMRYGKKTMNALMGDPCQIESDFVTATELLDRAKEKYHVFHFHITKTATGGREESQAPWKELLADNAIFIDDPVEIPKLMAKKILEIQKGSVSADEIDTVAEQITNQKDDEVIL